MRTKNLTPFPFGAKVTSRQPPQPEMTLVVRGRFTLKPNEPVAPLPGIDAVAQGAMTTDVFRDADVERVGECLYPSDFADFKLRAEVFLAGTCHTPFAKPLTECPVSFAVGSWSKTLRVIGRRAWSGSVISDPLPFTTMALGYRNAFGGPGHKPNPSGKGFNTDELPNVELAHPVVASRADRPPPASYGPINPAWPQRAGKVGRAYGAKYKAERAPFYAEDFDWSYFNAAPDDQQLEGYLRGDEELRFTNLHPAAPVFTAKLPAIRIRAFVKDRAAVFREVRMTLDTLFADVDEGVLTLVWRGLDKVAEIDLSDVKFALIASERLDEPPQRAEHYREILERFEQDPLELDKVLPPDLQGVAQTMKQQKDGTLLEQSPDPSLDPVSAKLQQKLGKMGEAEQAKVRQAMAQILSSQGAVSQAQPGTDINALLKDALKKAPPQQPAPVIPMKPGVMPRVRIGDAMKKALESVNNVKRLAADKNIDIQQAAAEMKLDIGVLDRIEALANDPRLKKLDPGYMPPGAEETPLPDPGPNVDWSERDLSGRDLSGLDLSGANLSGSLLTGANLRATILKGANLTGAVLFEAELSGADFSKADLTTADLGRSTAVGASFEAATLTQASFEGANLEKARLSRAIGDQPLFMRARLVGAFLESTRFFQGYFDEATIEQADFTGASLAQCSFLNVKGKRAILTRAVFPKAGFSGAELWEAQLSQVRGEGSIWLGAKLDRADFSHASLPLSHFTEAVASGARFYAADLREARFYRASLERVDFSFAHMLSVDLSRAALAGAKFNKANLFDAKFVGAAGAGCDFTGANLKRSTLETV